MKIQCNENVKPTALTVSAKRVLAVITFHAISTSNFTPGESNEYSLVLNTKDFSAAFPSLTTRRLSQLLIQLLRSTFSEPKLEFENRPVLTGEVFVSNEGVAQLTLSADYMKCIIKLGCLPI